MDAKSSLGAADVFALDLQGRHVEEMAAVKKQFEKLKMNFQVVAFCCFMCLTYMHTSDDVDIVFRGVCLISLKMNVQICVQNDTEFCFV